jgi:predicted secreted protein
MVQLEENLTTGYRWRINRKESSNLAIIQIDDLGHSAGHSKAPPIGASGVHRWSIKAVSAGHARIVFEYSRPWEIAISRRHEIAVEVISSR